MRRPCLLERIIKIIVPFQEMEQDGVHTWKTSQYPLLSPFHHDLHQKWHHSKHLKIKETQLL